MLTEARWTEILAQLEKEGQVKTQQLIEQLGVSESTIRRDLTDLEKLGKLIRIHGGAKVVTTPTFEPYFEDKLSQQPDEKEALAQFAATYVEPGETIYLDAGTTTFLMIPLLADKPNIRVVTNSMKHADLCAQYGLQVMIIGGTLKKETQAIIGSTAINQLKQYQFDRVFIGMNAISLEQGLTTPDPEEGAVKQAAIHQGKIVYCLVDQTKWEQANFFKVAELTDVIIITNKLLQEHRQKYQSFTNIKEVTTL